MQQVQTAAQCDADETYQTSKNLQCSAADASSEILLCGPLCVACRQAAEKWILKDWARKGWESCHSVSRFQVFGAVHPDSMGGSPATESQAANLPPKRELGKKAA